MNPKKFITDESAITVAVETILFFSISIIFLGMIFLSFQGLNQKQSNLLMEEQLVNIGNGIAKKMSDIIVEARISNTMGSHTSIKTDFWIPEKIVDDTYSIKLKGSRILLETTSGTYVSVEVPVDSSLILAENSTIYSTDDSHGLEYDSASGILFFTNGGVKPFPDVNAPIISIVSPADGTTIFNMTNIEVTVWDDVGVTRVEYYVNGSYMYSASSPFTWPWNTRTMDDGGCIVTAVAYDAAGNTKPDSRNYTVYNPFSFPPEITVISPLNGSFTDFHMPEIKARITDDKGIDFSSLMLLVDGYDQITNATYIDNSSKSTTLSYIPAKDMNASVHSVKLQVKDIDNLVNTVFTNWSFEVTPIYDVEYPTASIISPLSSASLVPGSNISVTYLASDASSGLDNLTINVTRNDGISYLRYETLSIYPYIVHDINPQEVWTFGASYVGGKNYTYRITAYDRSGKSINYTVGPLTVSLPGQSSELEINTSAPPVTVNGDRLQNIKLRDNVSDTIYVSIKRVNISWSGGGQIERVKFENSDYWKYNGGAGTPSGRQNSGTLLTLGSTYTAASSFKDMEIALNSNVAGKTFTIVFYMSDGTTSTVTFTAPS